MATGMLGCTTFPCIAKIYVTIVARLLLPLLDLDIERYRIA
jgi:hypothetical protein